MSKSKFQKSKFAAFISSRGFYVAIAVCLAGAGIATWLAVDRTISGIESQNSKIVEEEARYQSIPPLEEAAKPQSNVPKASSAIQTPESQPLTPSSSSSKPSSSSAAPSKPPAVSKQQEVLPQSVKLSYSLPVNGDILEEYSKGELVRNLTLGDWRTHDGVDISCEKGSDVLCAADGKVVDVKHDSLWGGVVTVEHADGRTSIYSGLASPLPVKAGENVSAKQALGKVEGVPCESADTIHVHFAMKENGKWIDPFSVIAMAG